MQIILKKILSAATIAGMVFSLSTNAFATPQTNDQIVIYQNTLQIHRNGKIHRSYPLKNNDIRITRSTKNNLLVGFTKQKETKMTHLVVGSQQKQWNITGKINQLELSSSLLSDWEIVLDGTAQNMHIHAPSKTVLDANAEVGTLNISNPNAQVSKVTGAKIGKITTVDGVTIKNIKKRPEQTATPTRPKVKTSVDFEEKDPQKFTRSIGFDTNEIILEARSGYPVGTAVRDVKLTVYETENSNRRVSGSWEFLEEADAESTKDGLYTYRFVPDDRERYGIHQIKINYTGAGDQRGVKRPELRFADRSHGSGSFTVDVTIPKTVEDDDILVFYITDPQGQRTTQSHIVDRSDAGETNSYSLSVSGNKGDRFKIKAKIKREHASDSSYSQTITYEID